MHSSEQPVTVAVLAFPEVTASTVFGMYDLFMSVGRDWEIAVEGRKGRSLMQSLVVSQSGEPFIVGNNVRITPDKSLRDCPVPDIVCVPEVFLPPGAALDERFRTEVEWLASCYQQGATIATACSGALLLAETGLLDGHEATTHWAYCDILTRRYPKIRVQGRRALVVSGEAQRLVMAGGGTSWQDLALFLIARSVGVEHAMHVARINLMDWHDIGQQPFAYLARVRQVDDAVIARCQVWIAQNYARAAPVTAMAAESGLAERSFMRRFQRATGMSPMEYVHTLRLEEAKQMLERTQQAVEEIARECGYEDPGYFSRLFKRRVGLTPARYRKRFGSIRSALSSQRAGSDLASQSA